MLPNDASIQHLMQALSVSQLAILLILMSYFPGPELRVFTATILNNATMSAEVESYGAGPLYLATSVITAAFAVASVLALLALVTLALKSLVEWRSRHETSDPVPEFSTSGPRP